MYIGRLLERDLVECQAAIAGMDRAAAIAELQRRELNNAQIGQVIGLTTSRVSRIVRGVPKAPQQRWACLVCGARVDRGVAGEHATAERCRHCGAQALEPSTRWCPVQIRLSLEQIAALAALAPDDLPPPRGNDPELTYAQRAIYALAGQYRRSGADKPAKKTKNGRSSRKRRAP